MTLSIDPIDKFEELKYSTYNNYYNEQLIINTKETNISSNFNNFSFFKFEISSLYNLALDKINNKNSFINLLKKTDIFKEKKYLDEKEFINLLNSELKSMKMFIDKSKINHRDVVLYNFSILSEEFDTFEKSYQLVKQLEKIINLEIKHEINESFDMLCANQRVSNLAKQKHLNALISTTTDEELRKILNIKLVEKEFELQNINQVIEIFKNTPVNSENFFAVKLNIDQREYLNLNKNEPYNLMTLVIKSTVFGILLAILFTLFYHHYFSKKKLGLKYRKNY